MLARTIFEMEPGDYVKTGSDRYAEVKSVYGILAPGKLAKPSEGGFGVITPGGGRVSMWEALAYCKRADLPEEATVE